MKLVRIPLFVSALLSVLPACAASMPGAAQAVTADVCKGMRETGAADILRSTISLRAQLPQVPADEASWFEQRAPHGQGQSDALVARPSWFVWQMGRQLDRVIAELGSIPARGDPAVRAWQHIDRANAALGATTLALGALTIAVSQARETASLSPFMFTEAQVIARTGDLEEIALKLNTLVACSLRAPLRQK
ncbi:hypothetical protein P3T23_009547 [Paraburkholderia sp. GAS448]|uniref:hypothetical protein n=1 Tax=Paraburkholderia sp. GAS448 TaxID=3035136 RepID=UPI003D248D53